MVDFNPHIGGVNGIVGVQDVEAGRANGAGRSSSVGTEARQWQWRFHRRHL